MTTSQMMKTGSLELISLLMSLANSTDEDAGITSETITAILASRGVQITLEGFEG